MERGNNERVVRKSFTWCYSGRGQQWPDSRTLTFDGIMCFGLVAGIHQSSLIRTLAWDHQTDWLTNGFMISGNEIHMDAHTLFMELCIHTMFHIHATYAAARGPWLPGGIQKCDLSSGILIVRMTSSLPNQIYNSSDFLTAVDHYGSNKWYNFDNLLLCCWSKVGKMLVLFVLSLLFNKNWLKVH